MSKYKGQEFILRNELSKLTGWWIYVQPHNREDVEKDIKLKIREINLIAEDKIDYESFMVQQSKRLKRGCFEH